MQTDQSKRDILIDYVLNNDISHRLIAAKGVEKFSHTNTIFGMYGHGNKHKTAGVFACFLFFLLP